MHGSQDMFHSDVAFVVSFGKHFSAKKQHLENIASSLPFDPDSAGASMPFQRKWK